MSPLAALSILGALKWPLTIAGAVLVFGVSSEGTLSLVAQNAGKLTKPIEVAPNFNLPPVRQIGELTPTRAEPRGDVAMTAPASSIKAWPARPAGTRTVAAREEVKAPRTRMAGSAVVTSAVNIRAGASKASAKLGTLAAGTRVDVAESSGGWVHVYYGGGDGWVYGDYLDGAGKTSQQVASVTIRGGAEPDTAEPRKPAGKGKLVKAGSRIVVREAPDSSSSTLYRLEIGENVKIVERRGGWSRIVTASGESGWIRAR